MNVKTNRSPFARAASLMLVLTLLLSCAVFGTMAKYTSTTSGDDTVSVAQWKIVVSDNTTADGESVDITVDSDETVVFDLFNTINDTDGGNAETDIVTTSSLIAPGTQGSFSMNIKNESEVTAEYDLTLEITNASGIPVQFSLDGTAWTDDITTLNYENTNLAIGADEDITVYWRWCFEGTDTGAHASQTDDGDTALGTAAQTAANELNVKVTIDVDQVD